MTTRDVVRAFLTAVDARDVDAAAGCFAADAPYQNVPHPAQFGPAGVRSMLTHILAASSEVEWAVVSEAYVEGRCHMERIDRFRIDGVDHRVACHGVIEVDETTGLITAFRDYVDLSPWRAEVGPAIERSLGRGRDHPERLDPCDHDGGPNTTG